MKENLLQLIGIDSGPAFVLVSARVSGLFMAAPIWSMAGVPRTVRGAAVVLLSILLLPAIGPVAPLPDDMMVMSMVLAGEVLMGVAIGVVGGMVIHGITIAGEVASLQMGLSLGAAIGALPEGATVGIGQLKSYFAMLIYLTLGGHLTLYQGLAASFAAVAPGQAVLGVAGGGQFVVNLAGVVFASGIRAAAPIIVALMLTNLALAILGKAVPTLNVMMLSFPITISIGLITLGASLPFLAAFLGSQVDAMPDTIGQAINSFTPATR